MLLISVQFHRDPVSAVDSCYQGDIVIVLPGIYSVRSSIFLPDSITVEGEEPDVAFLNVSGVKDKEICHRLHGKPIFCFEMEQRFFSFSILANHVITEHQICKDISNAGYYLFIVK